MELIRKEEAIDALVEIFKEKEKGGLLPKEFKRAINSCEVVEAIPIRYLRNTADMLMKTRTYADTVTANNIETIIASWLVQNTEGVV